MKFIDCIKDIERLNRCLHALDEVMDEARDNECNDVLVSVDMLDYISLELTKFYKLKCEQDIVFDEKLGDLYE